MSVLLLQIVESYLLNKGSYWIPKSHGVHFYDLKEQISDSQVQTLTLDDSLANLSFSFRTKLIKDSLESLHSTIGNSYMRHYVIPQMEFITREYFSRLDVQDVKQLEVGKLESEIQDSASKVLVSKGIRLTEFTLQEIELNQRIRVIIEKVEVDEKIK